MQKVSLAKLQDVLEAKYIISTVRCETVQRKQWVMDILYSNPIYFDDIGYTTTELKILFANYICDTWPDIHYNDPYVRKIMNLQGKGSDDYEIENCTIARVYNNILVDNNIFTWRSCTMKQHTFSYFKCTPCYDRRKWPIVAIGLYTLYPIITPRNPL
jgi:hypothetical protein